METCTLDLLTSVLAHSQTHRQGETEAVAVLPRSRQVEVRAAVARRDRYRGHCPRRVADATSAPAFIVVCYRRQEDTTYARNQRAGKSSGLSELLAVPYVALHLLVRRLGFNNK